MKCIAFAGMVIASLSCSLAAHADVVLSGTRIVFNQSAQEKTIRAQNEGKNPLLLQSWLDDGRENANPQELKLPFVVTPPVGRLDPNHEQTLKITSLGGALPADHESIFYLNILEIPPKPTDKQAESKNLLQLTFRTRIKMFYRPTALTDKGALDAISHVQWTTNGKTITARNDTPYYVSFSNCSLIVGGSKHKVNTEMLAPNSSHDFSVNGVSNVSPGTHIEWSALNDFGSVVHKDGQLTSH